MNLKFKFRIVSGLYDVQLDEYRPQFGLERQKKIGPRHLIVLFYSQPSKRGGIGVPPVALCVEAYESRRAQ